MGGDEMKNEWFPLVILPYWYAIGQVGSSAGETPDVHESEMPQETLWTNSDAILASFSINCKGIWLTSGHLPACQSSCGQDMLDDAQSCYFCTTNNQRVLTDALWGGECIQVWPLVIKGKKTHTTVLKLGKSIIIRSSSVTQLAAPPLCLGSKHWFGLNCHTDDLGWRVYCKHIYRIPC